MTLTVLIAGYGAFGPVHLDAWRRLGYGAGLIIADPNPQSRARARAHCPEATLVADWREALARAHAVDILTPSGTHHAIGMEALAAGKHLFIEKPVTTTAAEAADLLAAAQQAQRIVQCGLYFRFHPKAQALKRMIAGGEFGRLRYLSGRFLGLKRARGDSGVLHNDAVHFVDLLGWLAGSAPVSVYATARDHFGRGLDDLAVLQITYADGAAALVETGYVQPGRWPDAVVPGAITTKEIAVAGERAVAEIDFAAERAILQRGAHRLRDGTWMPDYAPRETPDWPAADPVGVVAAELAHFVACIETGSAPAAGLAECGVRLGRVIDAAILSARTNQVVPLPAGI